MYLSVRIPVPLYARLAKPRCAPPKHMQLAPCAGCMGAMAALPSCSYKPSWHNTPAELEVCASPMCTGENEACVRYVLDKYGSFMTLVPAEPRVGGPGLVGRPSLATALVPLPTSHHTTAQQPGQPGLDELTRAAGCDHLHAGSAQQQRQTGAGARVAAVIGTGVADAELATALEEEVWLTQEEAGMVQRFMPHNTNTIGFFVAAFIKQQSTL